jgi:cytidine deaminase
MSTWRSGCDTAAPLVAFHSNLLYIFSNLSHRVAHYSTLGGRNRLRAEYRELIEKAQQAKKRAFAPYSQFHVGAALLSANGKIYTGCNVEISTYALTICAERTAVFKAISEGDRRFKAIAVVSDDPGFTPPCGACRQVLMDLAGNIDFLMINGKGQVETLKMKALLPHAFGKKNLDRTRKKRG